MDKLPERPLSARSIPLTPASSTHMPTTQPQASTSKPPSRRTSGQYVYETLPSPPPDPRQTDNIFQFPSKTKEELPAGYHTLFNYVESEEEFYKTLYKIIANDCRAAHEAANKQQQQLQPHTLQLQQQQQQQTPYERHDVEPTRCAYCQHIRQECIQFIEPLQSRLGSSLAALLAAHGAVEQLSRLYALWDKYIDEAAKWRRQRECLNYVNLLNEKMQTAKEVRSRRQQQQLRQQHQQQQQQQQKAPHHPHEHEAEQYSDTEADLEESIALIESMLGDAVTTPAPTTPAPTSLSFSSFSAFGGGGSNPSSIKRATLKQQRERSKSMMIDDVASTSAATLAVRAEHERDAKSSSALPHMLRRQSTYSEGKSKVSKWTKVKAAFKWERANVPALTEGVGSSGVVVYNVVPKEHAAASVGLTPVNNEVARYLRVPSLPGTGGGSSADSILSSSSGHLLSETGTPGTISSASSMDDIDSSCRSTLRRDSTKSDSRVIDDNTTSHLEHSKTDDMETLSRSSKSDSNMRTLMAKKTSSIKSLRRNKNVTDFEALPENVVADLKGTTQRRTKPPPSPLNLNLKQDLTDSDFSYSPYSLKSPKDGTQSLNRTKKIGSPGNSSVPSSPSRHSDFFCEFESEDLSSGDFSEPTTPNHLTSHKSFMDEKNEINQRYQMLRAKFDVEFEAKRREWDKMKTNTNACRAIALITPPKPEEHPQHPVFNNNLSAKLLEENLTPDFKKKLRKWRVKKQISVSGPHPTQISPTSPVRDGPTDAKPKIDWNLWKTGQLKLEGQGLTPLPDQKDLPEDFQKKLEQWNKLKQGGGGASNVPSGQDSIKRSSKLTDSIKKTVESKPHEKDKLEKLAKLKAIVTDHPAKEIEVKTSEGVMKFEGISRKFTRKLYEWEKARGIGPESSTFALLHPGYRPIVVDRITKESHANDNSPTLGRSFSLDSIAQNNATLPAISQQASSLSLNDVNDLKEIDNHGSSDVIDEHDYKKYEEPEAVMVEVEDHIEETASPLVTAHTLVEQQTPIYKYEEGACSDYCNTRRVQSFESHTNLAPLLSVIQRTEENFAKLKRSSAELCQNAELRQCETMLTYIRNIYPYYSDNLMKPNVLNAISDVQSELSRISDLCEKSPLDEACCQEIIEERNNEYNEELKGLNESLSLLRRSIHGGSTPYPRDIVPDISITTVDVQNMDTADTTKDHISTTLEATDEWSASHAENDETDVPKLTQRTQYSNGNGGNGAVSKKKLRLRKTGSRQNSKTESDSSDADTHSVLETPRRIKRKNFRLKQRSFDDDYRRHEETGGDDVVYVLKVKPGHPIEQCENVVSMERCFSETNNYRPKSCSEKCLVATATATPRQPPIVDVNDMAENLNFNQNENVFVKTKRKVFTAVPEPNAIGGMTVIERELVTTPTEEDEALTEASLSEAEHTTQEAVELVDSETATEVGSLTPKRSNSTCRSLSQGDVRRDEYDYEDERKCHSAEKLVTPAQKQTKDARPPLASDSFRVINKSCASLMRESASPAKLGAIAANPAGNSPTEVRKEHRFKKNTEKSHYYIPFAKSQSGTIKKIETKIAKTHSGTSIGEVSPQIFASDRFDNTLPRIARKLERKSLTPTSMQPLHFDFPPPHSSEPTTPLHLITPDTPRTPLSERALRLQKAKEEFLQGNGAHSQSPTPSQTGVKRRDDIIRNETWEQYRRSDYSMGSVAGDETNLPKSFSVGTITGDSYTETPTHSDTGTDLDSSIYDSLPRSVSRSGKISSKLGFATLASKFRRGKGSKKGKDAPKPEPEPAKGNRALSALCRQTLMADVIAVPQLAKDSSHESVQKSQSSPQAGRGYNSGGGSAQSSLYGAPGVRPQVEQLNKSQSEQYVRRHKESIV
ncbi:uncharacterized protein LOC105218093 [Zeugodacus cucurbitae]|uniref:uncharacterized protein LOC105218093 n=1 Tax=Zeugodacus cucurbitae TaxID=28588 RepID=UPI0023D94438|nr:uncharacterized protein LOC105218093 [Zeugodacus cucurbitae]XP_011191752.2 uncharacterized protein LOC105218093 [Zeugodacus cucurbitae]XP_011191753.2 uncharacterized protein LOC105218093 [Zeugodacus cucurbitae]XP_054087644.1 uncharacterized protein LOC105218093 [Zeugodacus cucurbitae]